MAGCAIVALIMVTLTGCGDGTRTWLLSENQGASAIRAAVLTSKGSDHFAFAVRARDLTITARPGTSDPNIREVLWPAGLASARRSETCATWASSSSPLAQPGLALDIRQGNGGVSALTISVNVVYGVRWIFNVHYFDSADRANPFTLLDQWSFKSVLASAGPVDPLPWRACARIEGTTLEFKVWLAGRMSEPGWGDPRYSRTLASIPDQYLAAGTPGWYIGHIPPGGSVVFRDLGAQVSD